MYDTLPNVSSPLGMHCQIEDSLLLSSNLHRSNKILKNTTLTIMPFEIGHNSHDIAFQKITPGEFSIVT